MDLIVQKNFMSLPNVFNYADYRVYLKDWFKVKKKQGYSATLFSKEADLNSHTLLKMVIDGKRNLTYNTIHAFSKALNLKASEKQYFEKLVLFNQAKCSEDKADFFQELYGIAKKSKHKTLKSLKNYKEYYSHWYVVAIREMVNLEDFSPDPHWIAKKLKNKITKKEAQSAWKTLLDINLVRFNESQKKFEVIDPIIRFSSESSDFVIQNFHKEYLNRAFSSINEESIDERELSSLTLAVDEEDFQEIKKRVNEFRKYINLIYTKKSKKEKPDRLVAVNMQLLNLTTTKEKD